jgi:asparagine synthase (glutamine-hydrolysing)
MCGIVAILGPGAESPERLQRALLALRHRGPDGQGRILEPGLALGHVRLATIDLVGGAQPHRSEDGAIAAVVNGEFYGFEAERSELESRGHRFSTRTDSELLIHLYEERGLDCLLALRGEFAFVLWDRRQRQLFAARDRFGAKPLCFAELPGGSLALASEAKALFAAGLPAAWDREAFHAATRQQYPPPDRTLFRGVRQLEPGQLLLASSGEGGKFRLARWYDLDLPREEERTPVEPLALASELEEAVRLRLRGDVPVCCQLSGGLDSSAVLGLAAKCSPAPLHAFAVGFEDPAYDELGIAAQSAARAGAILHPLKLSARELADAFPDAVFAGEGLAINLHLPAKLLLHRRIRAAGFKVVLTGEGSDEVLAGYAHFRRDLWIAEGRLDRLAELDAQNPASAGIMLPAGESLSLEAARRRLGFIPSFLAAKGTLGHRLLRLCADDFTAQHAGHDPLDAFLGGLDPAQLEGRHPVDQASYLWIKLAFAGYLLRTLGDGVEMAASVEGRLPFLDHRLFELVRRIPIAAKIKDGVEKHLLREAVRSVVTPEVFARPKHPFLAPPLSSEVLQDTLRSRVFADQPFFDPRKVEALLDRLDRMPGLERNRVDPVLVFLASTAVLQERFRLASA